MSMDFHKMDKVMTPDDAFAIVLLATCESTKNILLKRSNGNSKRFYYLERMDKDIEGLNRTYEGYLPDSFQENAKKYHQTVEDAMNELLIAFRKEIENGNS